MANRFPLIVNPDTKEIQELKANDNLDLTGSGIYAGGSLGSNGQVLTSNGSSVEWRVATGGGGGGGGLDLNTTYVIATEEISDGANLNLIAGGTGIGTIKIKFLDNNQLKFDAPDNLTISPSIKLASITNSLLSNPSFNVTVDGVTQSVSLGGSFNIPIYGDVYRTASQTITNKTLSSCLLSGAINTFSQIPNTALINSSININGNVVPLGGSINITGGGGGSEVDTNTTYTLSADDWDVSNKKAIRLTGSDASTSNAILTAGDRISLTRSGGEIIITATEVNTDTNTTYSVSADTLIISSQAVGARLNLVGGGTGNGNGVTDRINFRGGNGIIVSSTSVDDITFSIGQDVATSSNVSFNNLNLTGSLTVAGALTYINTTNLTVTDKTIIIADGVTNSTLANGSGILIGTSNINLTYNHDVSSWESTTNFNLAPTKTYKIGGANVLSSTQVLGKSMPTGNVVGTIDTQTLSNKTLVNASVSSIINTGTVYFPAPNIADTLVGRNTSDILTNKTINGNNNLFSNIGNSSLSNPFIVINGSNVALGGSINTSGGGGSVSTEDVQDIVGGMLASGTTHSGISFAYNDTTGKINATTSSVLANLTVSTATASTTTSIAYNSTTGVLTYTPLDLTPLARRNQAETFSSVTATTSVSSASTLTNTISSLTNTAVSFPNGITLSKISIGNSVGNAGQFIQSTGAGVQWSTQSFVLENTSPTFTSVGITGDLTVQGTITTVNSTTLNVTNSEIVLNDNVTGAPVANASITANRGTSTDTSLRWNETSDRWEFTNDGATYNTIPIPAEFNNYNNLLNKPVIPLGQERSDWNAVGGVTEIINKPTLFSGSYVDLTDKPVIPTTLSEFSDVSDTAATIGNVLRWTGTEWAPSAFTGGSGAGGIVGPAVATDKAIPRYAGTAGLEISNSLVTISDTGVITAPKVGNIIPFFFPSVAELPNATTYAGAIGYVESGNALYYAANNTWTGNRIVTTNSTTTSDISVLIGNLQKTYSITSIDSAVGGNIAPDKKILRLSDSTGATADVVIKVDTGLSISRSSNEITLTGKNYAVSAVAATGTNATFRLAETSGITVTNNDITFVGADGLSVERTDASTITFRAPSTTVTQYTDALAKDAVFLALNNGTNVGISYTYDSVNKVINSLVSGGGGGGGEVLTYDLQGRNTTSNNAFVDLIPSTGTTDTIEFTGSGGTSVNWDASNKRITLGSVAPVSADWNATSGLAQIQNKPTIPAAYTLPTASTSVIGGVKVGANLTIDAATGVLSANPGSYTLPIASASTLGGIKIGTGLSVDANGVVNASAGSSVATIQDLTETTASLDAGATGQINITGYKAYTLFKIAASHESWIRIYSDITSRTADLTRSEGQDPAPGSGVISEVRTEGLNGSVLITPGVLGFNNDSPRTTTIYLTVTNRSTSAAAITVTLTALKIGE
jgi:hypothetical protein